MARHRDPDAMVINACEAIPTAPAPAMSANMIFRVQARPRLPMRELERMCEDIAARGDIEVVVSGHMRNYRWTAPNVKVTG